MSSGNSTSFKYVVLGGGLGAGYAAREFVKRGLVPGELAIVGAEHELPYERPALSKAVLFNPKVRLPGFHTCVGSGGDRQNRDFYETHGIAMMLGENVVSADLVAKTLVTESGKTIVAKKALILATGASPVRLDMLPGANLKGVMYLRDYSSALALYDALHQNIGKTVLMIGGGYIGMEVAAAAATVGCKVRMIFPEDHLMPRLFTPEIASHYQAHYAAKGVELLMGGRICKEFLDDGTGAVRGVRVCRADEDTVVEGSLVVVGVGAKPNTGLFADQLKMDGRGGIVVDSSMKTSLDGVYASGDIVTFPLKMAGARLQRMEHVSHARSSATHAVKSIFGSVDEYDYLPYFYSRVFALSWQFYGDNRGDCVLIGDFAPKLAAFWIEGGKVVGVFFESPSEQDTEAMQIIARTCPSVDTTALKLAASADEALAIVKKAAGLD
jgi:monodehydroascorbate reductase (NADH)